MNRFLAASSLLALVACNAQQTGDAAQCGLALYSAKVTNAAELIMAAQQVPACHALAIDAMQQVVSEVMAKRGIK